MNKRRQQVFPAFGPMRNGQQGLTLIEILVALGILAAVAVIFLIGMSTSSKAVMVSQESVAADSLAKSQMEYIKSQDYVKVAEYNPNDPAKRYELINIDPDLVAQGYAIAISSPQDVISPPVPGSENIQRITVTVTHDEKVFTLIGYKVNR
jgi:prepilin-type N-terminal cleavage/methylation domain-containing protein